MIETIWQSDVEDAEAFFEYAGYRARDMREPLERIGDELLDWITETFDSEGSLPHGDPWEEVSDAWRVRKDNGPLPTSVFLLRFTDDLIDAAIDESTTFVSRDQLTYVLDHPYAHIHQDGAEWEGKHGPARIPARPFVVVEDTAFEGIVREAFEDWLDEVKDANVRRRGLQLMNPAAYL